MPTFHQLRFAAGLSLEATATALAVSERTVQRYERTGAPAPVQAHLQLYAEGRIIPAQWRDWQFRRGRLCHQDGFEYRPADLLAAYFHRQHLETLRQRLRQPAQYLLSL